MRAIVTCLALLVGRSFAQAPPLEAALEKSVRDIRDVQVGMSRDHVLAGLGDKYDLTRIDDPKSESAQYGGEYWMIWPKGAPKSLAERESGSVRFLQGKVASIEIETYSSVTEESVRLAKHLFWLLYNRADPSAAPGKDAALDSLYKEANARWITVPMQLRESHDDKHEKLELLFTLGGQDFSMSIGKNPGQPDLVMVQQIICCATTGQK
ncbi:MAG: hypothetical protein ABSH37_06770 [Bryobacteraceae bacterium]|jgi:hypothetical protein